MQKQFNAERHLRILFWLFMALAVVAVLFAGAMVALAFAANADAKAGVEGAVFGMWMAVLLAVFTFLIATVDAVVAWGLKARTRWGRTAALVVSALSLPTIPVGTLVGAYGLWVLTKTETETAFRDSA